MVKIISILIVPLYNIVNEKPIEKKISLLELRSMLTYEVVLFVLYDLKKTILIRCKQMP